MSGRVTVGQLLATLEKLDADWPVYFETPDGTYLAPRLVGTEVDYDEVIDDDGWHVQVPVEEVDE